MTLLALAVLLTVFMPYGIPSWFYIVAVACILFFSVLLAIEMELIVSGDYCLKFRIDDYLLVALMIWFDIIIVIVALALLLLALMYYTVSYFTEKEEREEEKKEERRFKTLEESRAERKRKLLLEKI